MRCGGREPEVAVSRWVPDRLTRITSDFRNIADMQIKIGLNLYIPSGSLAGRLKQLPSIKRE